jgi:hypothetical protein
MLGRELLAQLLHHRDEAVQRAGRKAVRSAQVGQRVIGAVEVARPVDEQHQPFFFTHRAIVAEGRTGGDPGC